MRRAAHLCCVMKTIKIGETRRQDVRMLIPPKVLAPGYFRRGGTCTSNAEMFSELVPIEYQLREQRESSC